MECPRLGIEKWRSLFGGMSKGLRMNSSETACSRRENPEGVRVSQSPWGKERIRTWVTQRPGDLAV